jgi:hypothetical protein
MIIGCVRTYLAFIKLAAIRIWLRAYESTASLGSTRSSSQQPHSGAPAVPPDELNSGLFQSLLHRMDGRPRDIAAGFFKIDDRRQPEARSLSELRLGDVQQSARGPTLSGCD